MLLRDKVAVVTGGSRGIGRAIAEVFAREGAVTVICGRKQESLNTVASGNSREGKIVPIACHIGRGDDIQRFGQAVLGQFGRVDILVNNAATKACCTA